jgi:hypothetical protein
MPRELLCKDVDMPRDSFFKWTAAMHVALVSPALRIVAALPLSFVVSVQLQAQDARPLGEEGRSLNSADKASSPADVLNAAEWREVDVAVNRALAWLAAQQQADGSFPTTDKGQPGVTSLCMMAFIAHGHLPGEESYGRIIDRAADYILQCQKRNGLIALIARNEAQISRYVHHSFGGPIAYNHAISSLALSEYYGMGESERTERVQEGVEMALNATLLMQNWPKDRAVDQGGWRYIDDFDHEDADLSITGWHLMFLRSARNAGFDVPNQPVDEAVAYVRRTFSEKYGAFGYTADHPDPRSRGMAGAGILALANAGVHDDPDSQRSAEWLLQNNFEKYNEYLPFTQEWPNDRYHYGLFQCCQGMYQLGGRHWEQFFPPVVKTLLANQQADGSWPAESHFYDAQFGNAYTTALAVLSLGAANELLPIYER